MTTFITPVEKSIGANNAWTDIDCSAEAPSGSTGVIVRIRETGGWANNCGLRKNGSTDTVTFQIAANAHVYICIGLDSSRIIEAYSEDNAFHRFDIVGYFGSEAVFFTNAVAKTPTTGSWQTVSIASDTGGDTAIGAFIIAKELYNFGLRHGDSTDTRTFNGGSSQYVVGGIVGCNASEEFDVYSADSGTVWVTGYMTSGVTFNTNGTDRSLGSTGAYTDLAALPSGAIGGIYYVYGNWNNTWALRKNGSSDDRYLRLPGAALVECDTSRIVEGEISATTVDFWEQGYFTSTETSTKRRRMAFVGMGR